MADSLLDQLSKKSQRETAGADSASRFDYQKDWAFCRMIRKHIEGKDYLVAFEYHDDVVFLEPSDAPTLAEFCQVKTSSSTSPRRLSSLTSRPKGKDSILAKMVSNFDGICSSHEVNVVLVSNNAFDFSDRDVCAKDLDKKFSAKLLEKLQDEIPGFDPKKIEHIHFKVTGVSLDAMQSYLNGEAMDLFCTKFSEDHGLNVRTWIRLVQSEIARKNNHPSGEIATVDELVQKKCIDYPFVESTLTMIQKRSRKPADISLVLNHLLDAGWKPVDVMRLHKQIPQASNDFYNAANSEVEALVKEIKGCIHGLDGEVKEIPEFLADVTSGLVGAGGSFNPYRQPDYLRALGMLVYYEEI